MKPNETLFKARKRYFAVMVLCFLFGGFSLISFGLEAYSGFFRPEQVDFSFDENRFFSMDSPVPDANNRFLPPDFNQFQQARGVARGPPGRMSSSMVFLLFATGIVLIAAGIAIWSLTREKEIKSVKEEVAKNLLLPDEKAIVEKLRDSGFESTQSKIVKETGLGKVQVHRAIKRLEAKGLIEKHGYGLTNKIILKKEIFE